MRRCQKISTAPSPAREARARALLKSIDDCLDIRWFWTAVHEDNAYDEVIHWEGRYALITGLSPNDPELARARQTGEPDPHIILGWFTEDMNRANSRMLPCDEMEPKVRSFLGKIDGDVVDHGARLAALQISEFQKSERLQADVLDESVYQALEHRREITGIPFVGKYTTRRG
jgi:hypothetical protein